jgi:pimeloyl-ACP methyl ester carboxylesterase
MQTDRIQDYIEITRSLGLTTALIGHSYGGDAVFDGALYAARRGLRITYLATIDPVDGSHHHTVAEAGTVWRTSDRWIDVRSTTSDGKFGWWGADNTNDGVKLFGGPMATATQAVAGSYYHETKKVDHNGFVYMFETFAKPYLNPLYK